MAPVAQSHVPSELIHARASSIGVRGRRTRTPSPERKCLMLCVTRRRAPAPIAAARIGASFASASSRARSQSCAVGRWIWTGTARMNSSKSGRLQGATRIAWLAPVRDSSPAIRTSASTQTANGSVFSGRATQVLQGQLSGSTEAFHFGGKPRYDEHSGTEEHRAIEVDDRQGIPFTQPILLAQRRRKSQGSPASNLNRHGYHTENQHIRIPGSRGSPGVVQVRTQDVLPEGIGADVVQVIRQHGAALQQGTLVSLDELTGRVRVLPFRRS